MKLSIVITSLALISSTVTAIALPNEQDLVTRDSEKIEARMNIGACLKCVVHHIGSPRACHKECS